jgi:mRNA interferase RelE/StbE
VVEYRVVFARSARRELEGLEATVARRIISRVEALTTDPRPHGCVKLQGAADLWRISGSETTVLSTRSTTERASSTSGLCATGATSTGSGFTPNHTFGRTAGSHSLAAAGQRER